MLITAIGAVLIAVIKVYKNTQKEIDTIPRKVKKQALYDNIIIEKMESLKEYLNADRVQVYDFHNGGHYANGRSALKTSCTYEVVRSGITPKQNLLQSIPLSFLPKFISQLLNDDSMEIKQLDQIKEIMPSTYQLKKSQNINSFYDIVLNNKAGEPIGFLAVQFVKNKYSINEKGKQEVLRLKFFIEEQLENMNLKKGRCKDGTNRNSNNCNNRCNMDFGDSSKEI